MYKLDKDNIMKEFVRVVGGIEIPQVALYNKRRVSEAEVNEVMQSLSCGSKNVIIIDKQQFGNVFVADE